MRAFRYFGWFCKNNVQYLRPLVLVGTVTFTTNGSILQIMEPDVTNQSSPRPFSVPVPGLADCSLSGGVKSTKEVGTIPPPFPNTDEFNISVANLHEKLGFSSQFQEELAAVGGNVHSLAVKLLNLFNLDDSGKFRAG